MTLKAPVGQSGRPSLSSNRRSTIRIHLDPCRLAHYIIILIHAHPWISRMPVSRSVCTSSRCRRLDRIIREGFVRTLARSHQVLAHTQTFPRNHLPTNLLLRRLDKSRAERDSCEKKSGKFLLYN
jgi:hypothetical protein